MARYGLDGQCLECGAYGQPAYVPQDGTRNVWDRHEQNYISVADPNPWRVGHDAFHEGMIPRTEVQRMSNVLWCDPGNHAFKAGRPGAQRASLITNDDDGNPVRQELDCCPEHSFSGPAPDPAKVEPHAIPRIVARPDTPISGTALDHERAYGYPEV